MCTEAQGLFNKTPSAPSPNSGELAVVCNPDVFNMLIWHQLEGPVASFKSCQLDEEHHNGPFQNHSARHRYQRKLVKSRPKAKSQTARDCWGPALYQWSESHAPQRPRPSWADMHFYISWSHCCLLTIITKLNPYLMFLCFLERYRAQLVGALLGPICRAYDLLII